MSSSLQADYATIKVISPCLHGTNGLVSKRRVEPPATSPNFASVPTDHPSLALAIPRVYPPHPHFRSRILLLNVSSRQLNPKCDILISLSLSLSSLPKGTVKESTVAILASVLGGFGTVAMFCTAGVYV